MQHQLWRVHCREMSSRTVLVVGGGGREHALAWKLSQSLALRDGVVYVAPGNGGTERPADDGHCRISTLGLTKPEELVEFAVREGVRLVVIGPEAPLAEGLGDRLVAAGVPCFGPSAAAAQLESSKAFAKAFMARHGIPTARFGAFTNAQDAEKYIRAAPFPVVVKASGLAAGKGVIMPDNVEAAVVACRSMFAGEFGAAGAEVVVEERLTGFEASVLAFSDGQRVAVMPAAQDHKRAFDWDMGPNTGGMGVVCPSPAMTPDLTQQVVRTILQPAVSGMAAEGTTFVGVLFAGVMVGPDGVARALEYNCRFGDPETQALMVLLQSDLLQVMEACVQGRLEPAGVQFTEGVSAATVVVASHGYPGAFPKGLPITGLEGVGAPAVVFHAGTRRDASTGEVLTAGGRVLAVTATGASLPEALRAAYVGVDAISFEGAFSRRDIGGCGVWRVRPSEPLRIGVLGSTRGTDLAAVLAACTGISSSDGGDCSARLDARVAVVISDKEGAGILDKARAAGVPAVHLPAVRGQPRSEYDRALTGVLLRHQVDVVLLIGFMRILSPEFTQRFTWRALNVHPSLLPHFAGGMDTDVHAAVLAAGCAETGCTVHYVEEVVDAGVIAQQRRCAVEGEDTPESLKAKVQALEGEALVDVVSSFARTCHVAPWVLPAHQRAPPARPFFRLFRVCGGAAESDDDVRQAERVRELVSPSVSLRLGGAEGALVRVAHEVCFAVELEQGSGWQDLSAAQQAALCWLLSEASEGGEGVAPTSALDRAGAGGEVDGVDAEVVSVVVELGPRLNFATAWSTNAGSVLSQCGLSCVRRVERLRRVRLELSAAAVRDAGVEDTRALAAAACAPLYDRMTEWVLPCALRSLSPVVDPRAGRWGLVPVLSRGEEALREANARLGLAMDAWDVAHYTRVFREHLRRDPTEVELFDVAQSNSEHSRHWFFKGRLVVDGQELGPSLFDMVTSTLTPVSHNSVLAFCDNSSAITGYPVPVLQPASPGAPGKLEVARRTRHLLLTAETHNFPSGVAPFPGAETGSGGRIRDTHATGTGSLVGVGIAGYCVGALMLPEDEFAAPWEPARAHWPYPGTLATPLQIALRASDGASDYGNKFGEPLVAGFARSFALRCAGSGERREWIKPIMFSAGLGQLDAAHARKGHGQPRMLLVKLGGPAYRIGMGGSAASSLVQGDNSAEADFNAVQRGDAEMENKLDRVVRACVELGEGNPIVAIHDQGAGGNCNVLKELVDPHGGIVRLRKVLAADPTLTPVELWGAEYQENDALLVRPEGLAQLAAVAQRERCPMSVVGEVTGDGRIVVEDGWDGSRPVDMPLDVVLGKMPRKVFELATTAPRLEPLRVPASVSLREALSRVLRLMSVGSKRWLTSKVDRSVTGRVALQQCVGPLHTPVADCAVMALSLSSLRGGATAVGEQPLKSLLCPRAMARLALGEALTNLCNVAVAAGGLRDIKCSGNWMWAAKLPGEGAALVHACQALCDAMLELGVAVDGGKDSLSMAARCPDGETVKAPGELVITAYAPVDDVTRTATPDLKGAAGSSSVVVHIPMAAAATATASSRETLRLGGSALAHAYAQLGSTPPDMDEPAYFARAWRSVQALVRCGTALAVHDVSDGGVVVSALEMAMAGNRGLRVRVPPAPAPAPAPAAADEGGDECSWPLRFLFAEELGVLVEVAADQWASVRARLRADGVACTLLGTVLPEGEREFRVELELEVELEQGQGQGVGRVQELLRAPLHELRAEWESLACAMERRQRARECADAEAALVSRAREAPVQRAEFDWVGCRAAAAPAREVRAHRVCVLREEGSNGDREMAGAFQWAGFEVHDVTMSDLAAGRARLDGFRGVAFVGGFSYGDVLGSARGWAGCIRYNDAVRAQFEAFRSRRDTFSLGVCNGCQLMAQLGWVGALEEGEKGGGASSDADPEDAGASPLLLRRNRSGLFESRWVSLAIGPSRAVLLRGMQGSVLGVWSAHGEGRFAFRGGRADAERAARTGLVAAQFADDAGVPTEQYPHCPNGSPLGIAAVCSPDGRHLAVMPHPERAFLAWQWPQMPAHVAARVPPPTQCVDVHTGHAGEADVQPPSPWARMFANAWAWCDAGQDEQAHDADADADDADADAGKRTGVTATPTTAPRDVTHAQLRPLLSHPLGGTALAPLLQRSDAPSRIVECERGKVRDVYRLGGEDDGRLVLVTTDRLSAFDRNLTTVPGKGAVLNLLSAWWFRATADIVPNHVLAVPHPCVTVARRCSPLPVEVVVRGYLTGTTNTSVWTYYDRGERSYCGHDLPDGLSKNARLPHNIVTPTTKSATHDEPISGAEVVSRGLLPQQLWQQVESTALQLFERGQQLALARGLILVDTKYEFGLSSEGALLLIDEVHTPDSSRYWVASTYEQRMAAGHAPEHFDKEFVRLWYRAHCDPYADAVLPDAPDELRLELGARYIRIYQQLTGQEFPLGELELLTCDTDVDGAMAQLVEEALV